MVRKGANGQQIRDMHIHRRQKGRVVEDANALTAADPNDTSLPDADTFTVTPNPIAAGNTIATTATGRQPLPASATAVDAGATAVSSASVIAHKAAATTAVDDGEDDTAAVIPTTAVAALSRTAATAATVNPVVASSRTTALRAANTPSVRITPSSSPSSASTSSSSSGTSASSGLGASSDSTTSSSSNSSHSHAGVIAGVIIALLALLVIAAYFGLRWKKKRSSVAENDAIYPYGGTGNGAGGINDKFYRNSGYNQHVNSNNDNSFDDLAAPGGAAAVGMGGYGAAAYTEKTLGNGNNDSEKPLSGMAGYGTLSMLGNDNNDINGMAGRASYTSTASHQMIGRDAVGNVSPLVPGSYVTNLSSKHNNMGNEDGFTKASPGMGGVYTDIANIGYPPVQQGQGMQSPRGPQAAMMRFDEDAVVPTDRLPPHQDQALSAAVAYADNGNRLSAGSIKNVLPLPTPVNDLSHISMYPASGQLIQQQDQVQSQGPFADPQSEGKVYVVTRVFEPSMPDELVFYPGDRIQIVVTYDDGWCLGCNLTSSARDGRPPARGVFPRDCVEELLSEPSAIALPASRAPSRVDRIPEEDETDELNELDDRPLANTPADLQRAPTLPPLDIGNASRFSMGAAANTRLSYASQNTVRAGPEDTNRKSLGNNSVKTTSRPFETNLTPLQNHSDDFLEANSDAYGGFSSASPLTTAFPPDIQVSGSPAQPNTTSFSGHHHQFGSTQHIADYASQLDEQQDQPGNQNRLSTLEEANGHIIDEFPSTPRTAVSPNDMASKRSSSRLSVLGGKNGISHSTSGNSIKRTSSLIASKDADLFLALGDTMDGKQ